MQTHFPKKAVVGGEQRQEIPLQGRKVAKTNKIMDSSTSHQNETGPKETKDLVDSALAIKAQAVGAAFMLPPHELDSPLSADEILPRFGEPVVDNGVNYTALAYDYLDAVSGRHGPSQEKQKPGSTLKELANTEVKSIMEFNVSIVRDHDSQAHRRAGILRFENYVAKETGKTFSRSTLQRRMVHAKFALIFAAGGAIDILPSQNQANLIGQLPRHVWLPFWRGLLSQHPSGKMGDTALKEAVPLYATRHQLPLRGERLEAEQKILPLPDASPAADPKPEVGPPPEKAATKNRELTRQEADQEIIKLLNPILQEYLPRRTKERLKKKKNSLGRQYLSAIRAAVRQTPSPFKRGKRSNLFNAIATHHPALAEDVLRLMLGLAFEQFDEKLK